MLFLERAVLFFRFLHQHADVLLQLTLIVVFFFLNSHLIGSSHDMSAMDLCLPIFEISIKMADKWRAKENSHSNFYNHVIYSVALDSSYPLSINVVLDADSCYVPLVATQLVISFDTPWCYPLMCCACCISVLWLHTYIRYTPCTLHPWPRLGKAILPCPSTGSRHLIGHQETMSSINAILVIQKMSPATAQRAIFLRIDSWLTRPWTRDLRWK